MMKKFINLFFAIILSTTILSASAITFEEAYQQTKPVAVVIYADWADGYDSVLQAFDSANAQFESKYNFVKLNIADKDTAFFNKKYHIYPNLPYVLLFKDRGRISRYLTKDCVLDKSCFSDRLNMFVN